MSPKFPITLASVLVGVIPQCGIATDNPPVPPTTPVGTKAPEIPTVDPHDFLKAASTQRILKMPLDLTVQKADVKDVAAQVEKTLTKKIAKGEAAPSIEVRGVQPILLNFAAKDSTVGAVLSAVAMLAGARLYSFAGYALIAPESALLPEELSTIKLGLGRSWGIGNYSKYLGQGAEEKRRSLTAFIAQEMGGAPKDWGADTPPTTRTKPIEMGQLSPDAQAMLKELITDLNDHFLHGSPDMGGMFNFQFNASSDTQVTLSLLTKNEIRLNVNSLNGGGTMHWNLSGSGFGGGGGRINTTPSTSPSAPPLDLSAGKA